MNKRTDESKIKKTGNNNNFYAFWRKIEDFQTGHTGIYVMEISNSCNINDAKNRIEQTLHDMKLIHLYIVYAMK